MCIFRESLYDSLLKSYNFKFIIITKYFQPISGDIKVIEINITMLSKLRWLISAIINR